MARLRAVETRRWLLRASHSGISAVVDADGGIVARLPFATAGTLVRPVPLRDGMTLYVRLGEWVVAGSAAVLLGAVVVAQRRRGT
jgi:apolipoprotein N-acyltransferase